MGNFIFVALHLIAAVFFAWGLFLTIPLHLIYTATKARRTAARGDEPSSDTHVRCPACRELVRMDASKCKHCGTELTPHAVGSRPAGNFDLKAAVITVVVVVGMLVVTGAISSFFR